MMLIFCVIPTNDRICKNLTILVKRQTFRFLDICFYIYKRRMNMIFEVEAKEHSSIHNNVAITHVQYLDQF